MEIRVLGCYGNQMLQDRTTCLVVNKTIAIDAGALTSALTFEEQLMLDHILITHSHLDHIKDLAFLGDTVIGRKEMPVVIHGEVHTIKAITDHYFNNIIWPDFTCIPTKEKPVFSLDVIEKEKEFDINGIRFFGVQTPHPVHTLGYFIRDNKNSVLHVSDTGITDHIWEYAAKEPNLRAIFIEASFPNDMHALAKASGHLTPDLIAGELAKVGKRSNPIDVFVYHLKPLYKEKLIREIHAIRADGFTIHLMEQDSIISYA